MTVAYSVVLRCYVTNAPVARVRGQAPIHSRYTRRRLERAARGAAEAPSRAPGGVVWRVVVWRARRRRGGEHTAARRGGGRRALVMDGAVEGGPLTGRWKRRAGHRVDGRAEGEGHSAAIYFGDIARFCRRLPYGRARTYGSATRIFLVVFIIAF